MVAAAASMAVVAAASTSAGGLPSYTNGYAQWHRINAKPFTRCGPPCAHSGVKNVYASKRKAGKRYPNGTVVVKTVAQPGDRSALPSQVATMRKVAGRGDTSSTGSRGRATRSSGRERSARAVTLGRVRTTTSSRSDRQRR
jgi:hypothetical protein